MFNSVKAQTKNNDSLILNPRFVKSAQEAIDSLYDYNYKASVRILKPWKEKYPDSPIWPFWKGMHIWWEVLPDFYNHAHDKELVYQFSKVDYECTNILSKNDGDLDALIVKAASNAFLARYYSNREKWVTSFQYGKKAVDVLFQIKKIDPSLPDIQFGLGIYNYYTAYLPKEYPILNKFSWLLPKGNQKKGIRQLKDAADSSAFVRPESLYFLGRIYMMGEHNMSKALPYFVELAKRYQHNTYYKRILIRIFYDNGDFYNVLSLANASLVQAKRDPGPFSYAVKEDMYAYKGLVLYQMGNYKKAINNFKKSQGYSLKAPGGNNRSDYLLTGYYLGYSYQNLNKLKSARKYYKEVSKINSDSKFVSLARKKLNALNK